VAFVLVLITSGLSDKLKARDPFLIWGCVVAIVGYAMLLASKRPAVQYGGTFPSGFWNLSRQSLRDGWLSNNLVPHNARATGVAIANCAAFVATFTYLSKDA
jgi:hypothetical protein